MRKNSRDNPNAVPSKPPRSTHPKPHPHSLPEPRDSTTSRKPTPSLKPARAYPFFDHPLPPTRLFAKFKPGYLLKRFGNNLGSDISSSLFAISPQENPKRSGNRPAVQANQRILGFSLSRLLELICFHNYSFDELRPAIAQALHGHPSLASLITALCDQHIRPFIEAFENHTFAEMKGVVNIMEDCQREGEERDAGVLFVPVSRNLRLYSKIIENVHGQYLLLERVFIQIEKIIKLFISIFSLNSSLNPQLQQKIFQSWRFTSDINYMFISHVHNFLQDKIFQGSFLELYLQIKRIAQIHYEFDPTEINCPEQAKSTTPTRDSGQLPPPNPPFPHDPPLDPVLRSPDNNNKKKQRKKKRKKEGGGEVEVRRVEWGEVKVRRRAKIGFEESEKKYFLMLSC